jgi:hypothetical protein
VALDGDAVTALLMELPAPSAVRSKPVQGYGSVVAEVAGQLRGLNARLEGCAVLGDVGQAGHVASNSS